VVFSSIIFLVWFLPLFLLLYKLADRAYKNALLLVGSCIFYAWGAPQFIFVLLGTSFLDFQFVRMMHRAEQPKAKRIWLALSLCLNLGLLAYFKYYNFFLENVSEIAQGMGLGPVKWTKVVLPLGISFFVFESLTYVIDVYRGVHAPLKRFWDYQMYILYFPKLIAGPIVRYHEIADQIADRTETSDLFLTGFYRLVIGLAKKVLIANKIGLMITPYFATDPAQLTAGQAWIGVIGFMMQIYFDFSGYSDMALGLSRMFGFRLPENFNNPFVAASMTEFWQRWHISLSTWFQVYLFTPLALQLRNLRMWGIVLTIFITFLASGLWHGAAWNFVFWGAFHGILLAIDRIFLLRILQKLGRIPGMIFVWLGVTLSFVIFKIETLDAALGYYRIMFTGGHGIPFEPKLEHWITFACAIAFALFAALPFLQRVQNRLYADRQGAFGHLILFPASIAVFVFCMSTLTWLPYNPFLYFRF
jgi:alginate O-acetyltransferase complex protein AlgI